MPLFKKKKGKKTADGELKTQQDKGHANHTVHEEDLHQQKPFKYAPNLSKKTFNIGGLPVNVFGLDELSPASSRALAPDPPEVCVAIHMHGRGGTANNEERLVRHMWDRAMRSKAQFSQQHQQQQQHQQRQQGQHNHDSDNVEFLHRELLIVNFDARNHGHRLTNELGQKGWKQGNSLHAIDLYSMVVGTARDVAFLIDFLPAVLFPHDERKVSQWTITGKSLGGHAAWHVLMNDARVTVGVPFISCPDFNKLLAHRAPKSFVTNGPPYVPQSLRDLVNSIDPAKQPFNVQDPRVNPFIGKRICVCSGAEDRLVPWLCAQEFVDRLIVAPPSEQQQHYFRVVLLEGVGHEVTERMIEEAGHWIYLHEILSRWLRKQSQRV